MTSTICLQCSQPVSAPSPGDLSAAVEEHRLWDHPVFDDVYNCWFDLRLAIIALEETGNRGSDQLAAALDKVIDLASRYKGYVMRGDA